MKGNTQTDVRGRNVVCARCGGLMDGRLGSGDSHTYRLLWWTCENGHTSDVLPVPEFVLSLRAGPRPQLSLR